MKKIYRAVFPYLTHIKSKYYVNVTMVAVMEATGKLRPEHHVY